MLDLRVSEKGCVSLYGTRRFPISLYAEEWEQILAHREQIEAFIAQNEHRISRKNKKTPAMQSA